MKKISISLFLFFFNISFNLSAQIQFEAHTIIDNTSLAYGVFSVHSTDLDGDGDLDVLSASVTDDKIAWYKNMDGQGNFGKQQIITVNADGARSVHSADLDGDGDMDVLSASFFDSKIAWYENLDGSGNFGTQQIISINAENARSVYASDLDGDGDMDVLSASFDDDKIAWYENLDGLGDFNSEQVITTNAVSATSVFAADLDGDGDMDILSSSRADDKIAWYENLDGLGNFSSQLNISLTVNGASNVKAFDLDGDADLDVLAASLDDGKITWYENLDGLGNFGTEQTISIIADGVETINASDLDGDGDLDVLSASFSDDKIAWYENMDGLGNFGLQQIIPGSTNGARSVIATDINGDGDMDVLSTSQIDNKIAWNKNLDGLGDFSDQEIISANSDGASSVYASDIDNDGDLDVLSAAISGNNIAWYENLDGLGNYGRQQIITTKINLGYSVFASDLDNDGMIDVLSASCMDNKIAWYRNIDGLGDFGDQQIISTDADGANTVYTSDLDWDGDLDILSASGADDKVAWFENLDSLGNFGAEQIITIATDNINSVYAADLDGDGDMDVLSASGPSDKIFWYENMDGLGSFGTQQIIITDVSGTGAVLAVDLDNDGDTDVLSANTSGFAWYENLDGLGNFGAQQIIANNLVGARSVYATDLDNDGDLDVLSASQYDNRIAWYENTDGLGTFGSQQIISSNALEAASVYAADLDGDGDMDVLSASIEDGKIAWYENVEIIGTISPTDLSNLNFDIYPNPTTGLITIATPTNNIAQIAIYNGLGQLVLNNRNEVSIDLSSLAKGLYFCEVQAVDGSVGIRKVIKNYE